VKRIERNPSSSGQDGALSMLINESELDIKEDCGDIDPHLEED